VYKYHILLIHLQADSTAWPLWIVLWLTWMCRCFIYFDLYSFGSMLKSFIAWSYVRSTFSSLRNHHIGFHSGCTHLHFQQQCISVLLFPASLPAFALLVYFLTVILTMVRWTLNIISIVLPFWLKMLNISSCVY
jgi:hypothetical protein